MPPRLTPLTDFWQRRAGRSWARTLLWALGGVLLAGSLATLAWFGGALELWAGRLAGVEGRASAARAVDSEVLGTSKLSSTVPASLAVDGRVLLAMDRQKAIGLQTEPASSGAMHEVLRAPGTVVPDENAYAFITPRASGVVRSVAAHIGQDVKAGDLLATIDSAEVAQARLDLVTELQELEIARTRADWQTEIYQATLALIERLKAGDSPTQIQEEFENRAVGENRERLMTAYAKFRLAEAVRERSEHLRQGDAVSVEDYQQAVAEYEAAMASYKSLMDRVGFEARLEYARLQQERKQAETSVRVARERLRVLGVRPDGTEPEVREGKVVGVQPDGTLPASEDGAAQPTADLNPEEILPEDTGGSGGVVEPVGVHMEGDESNSEHSPISTYSIWAPFNGTIIDRQLVVPGVFVGTTNRIYQLADLSKVWIEVKVQEADFDELVTSQKARVQFTSPAYPGKVFEGKVI
ncbi:MAG TPA: efflux RND transporter periplasmic adaptor subunit, partial [Isosphaeraceae bacterium]|nr:efflux RND transporter periplasmic adaptor subunit [Isosphaeraceae bacterium]